MAQNVGGHHLLEPVQSLDGIPDTAKTRHRYPSDISCEQFEQIRPLLESARKKTAPRKVDLYDVFCAVLYLLAMVA
jgi:hypothetical protein